MKRQALVKNTAKAALEERSVNMTFFTNLTLWKKIALIAIIWLLLGVGVFSSLSMRALNQSTKAMLQERLTTTHLIADYTDEVLDRAIAELSYAAGRIETGGAPEQVAPVVQSLQDIYSRMSISVLNVFLLDNTGRIVWSTEEGQQFLGYDLSAYSGVNRSLISGRPEVSGQVQEPASGAPAIFLTSAIGPAQEALQGLLVAAIDLSQSSIGGFIQPVELGDTGYVEIVDNQGVVIARTQPGRELAGVEMSDHPERFAELIAAGLPAVRTCHTCHTTAKQAERKDVLAFYPLERAPWGVAIRQYEQEALAPTRELRLRLIVSGVGLLAITSLLAGMLTRGIVRRIGILNAACNRMADGDLVSPVGALGRDEIGALARTFEDMRGRLKTSYEELEQRTRELSSLLTVSQILTSTLDITQLLNAAVAKAVEVIPGADGGALLLSSADKSAMVVKAVARLKMETPLHLPLDSIGAESEFVVVQTLDQGDEAARGWASDLCRVFLRSGLVEARVEAAICAPVVSRGDCIGSLVMVSLRNGPVFQASDLRLLQAITDDVAIAIEREQLSKEAEQAEALREADRLRSQFISAVSHELRTPLTSIKGYSTSLLREDVVWDEATRREFLQVIDEKTDELREMIEQLLQVAKLEAGALKLEKEPVLVPHLAQKVIEDASLRTKRHTLTLDFPPHFPVVEADARHVEQILRNLVENAIKYSPHGGEIRISGAVGDGHVRVSVKDEGVGIPREEQHKIFQRFYRVDSPLTRTTPGSGLGLAIVKGLVEAHGGKIWFESEVDRGTTFHFTLALTSDSM